MKKSIIFAAALAVLLTGCSAENKDGYGNGAAAQRSEDAYYAETYAETTAAVTAPAASYDMKAAEDFNYFDREEAGAAEETASSSGVSTTTGAKASGNDNTQTQAADAVKREMLVYTCRMEIDTLEFQNSVDSFKKDMESYGGFIEQENYSDGGGGGRWYQENSEKWQSYTATVRIPSGNYDAFCNSAGELGELRSKNASVQNFSQEYTDLAATLEIYEAKEKRYIALLADITEDEYAVAVERELTEIEIQIANIRTRMNTIRADVAYSYVYITINEVKEYSAEPIKTDTFADRLGNTLKNAGSGFLSFLEGLLFLLIYLAPYLLLIGLIALIVLFVVKNSKGHKAARKPVTQSTADTAGTDEEGKK